MAEFYVFATIGVLSQKLWRFPNENGDRWEFRPAAMGHIDVFQHHPDGSVSQRESILADIKTLTGVKA